MRSSIILEATLLLAAASVAVQADVALFVPRPTQNGAFLNAEASREEEDLRLGPRRSGWTDGFFREKLTLFSNGYVYHPRFLQYRLSLGGVLRQEKYQTFAAPPADWASRTGVDYNARLLLLPEHPYHGELFAERFAPQFKERSAIEHDTVGTTRGASLHYRRKPYFLDATGQDNTLESSTSRSDVTSYRLRGQFFKEYRERRLLSLSATANPTHFTSNSVKGDTREYSTDGLLSLPPLSLSATAGKNSLDQNGEASSTLQSDQRYVSSQLAATLPAGFRSHLAYANYDNQGTVQSGQGEASRAVSSTSGTVRADVSHRLYQSLDTSYAFQRARTTSSQGESTLLSHVLAADYTKSIPRGRIHFGANRGWATTDSRGQVDVVNEAHSGQAVPGTFVLGQPEVDPASIRVFLKSPLAPFENELLAENVDYVVLPVLNTIEIRVLGLPARFVVPGTYDFLVFYSLARATFDLRSNTFSVNLGAELWDQRLAPYASYATVSSHLAEGSFPGPLVDTTSRSAGLAYRRGGLQARAHYDTIDWDVSPSRTWAVEAQYRASVGATTRLSASATYQDRYFPRGSAPSSPQPIRDDLAQASGGFQQQLFTRSLVVAGNGSLTRLTGRARGNAYGVNGSLSWRTGRLTLDAGASASWGNTEAVEAATTSRSHQFYYVTLRRDLF